MILCLPCHNAHHGNERKFFSRKTEILSGKVSNYNYYLL